MGRKNWEGKIEHNQLNIKTLRKKKTRRERKQCKEISNILQFLMLLLQRTIGGVQHGKPTAVFFECASCFVAWLLDLFSLILFSRVCLSQHATTRILYFSMILGLSFNYFFVFRLCAR